MSMVMYAASSQKGDRDQLLGASLGVLGVGAGVVEAPQDDDPCERFDQRVRAPNAISATDPATTPAPIATAASLPCHASPRRARKSRAGLEPSPLRAGSGPGRPRSGVKSMTGSSMATFFSMSRLARCSWRVGRSSGAVRWRSVGFVLQRDLGRSPRTSRRTPGRWSTISVLRAAAFDVVEAGRAEIARYVRDLRERPGRHGANVVALDSGEGLSIATLQLRVTVVRLFYDFLVEERVRDRNPVGRGYRSADGRAGRRGLVGRMDRLPWIPTDVQWRAVLEVAAGESLRNRLMLALAYDAALRREELCLLATDDLDPAHRTLRVRAETTKTRRGRVVPYSAGGRGVVGAAICSTDGGSRPRGARCSYPSRRGTGRSRSLRGRGRRSSARSRCGRAFRRSAPTRCGTCV